MYPLLLPNLKKNVVCEQMPVELPCIKFHENLLRCLRVVTCGQTDMTGPTVAFFLQCLAANGDRMIWMYSIFYTETVEIF
jgi:hypothetical protein